MKKRYLVYWLCLFVVAAFCLGWVWISQPVVVKILEGDTVAIYRMQHGTELIEWTYDPGSGDWSMIQRRVFPLDRREFRIIF